MVDNLQSLLFVPANRPDRFQKAAASGADAVILDLEDAVAPEDKAIARAALTADFTELPVIVRVNAMGTRWHDDDLKAVQGLGCAGVILPKTEDAATVASLKSVLVNTPVIALIETAQGIDQVRGIARADGVKRLAFGSIDLCADIGAEHIRENLLPYRSALVIASRLAGIAAPIDGVTLRLDDSEALHGDVAHARSIGMTGKLCIHPRQVPVVASEFAPTRDQINWARRIVGSGEGIATLDGEMVDRPVRLRAQRILDASRVR